MPVMNARVTIWHAGVMVELKCDFLLVGSWMFRNMYQIVTFFHYCKNACCHLEPPRFDQLSVRGVTLPNP
jgi:hypothetical protein